jgi:hypothetical protein
MNAALTSAPRARRWGTRLAIGTAAFASLAGVYAFRTLTARPGEDALRFVPANALIVGTIDLSPSASQVVAFKKIDDALARNGLNGFMESSLIDLFEPSAKGREGLRPLVLRNGAVAMLPGEKGGIEDAKPVAFLAVSSGADAQKTLEKEGEARYFKGVKYYKLRHGSQIYMVVDDLLVVAPEPAAFYAVRQIQNGAPSITSIASFTGSRSSVAQDANIMLFFSPKMLVGAPKATEGMMADWMTVGLAVREGGLGISFAGATDTAKEPMFATLGQTAPVRTDLFRVLPAGMYGSMVYSQPSKAIEAMEKGLMKDEDMKKGIKEMEEGMRKEAGLDLRKDVLPAFNGTTILAAYPNSDEVSGVDALLVIDDMHGGDPANAVDRLTHWIEEQIEKEGGNQELYTRTEKDGVTWFRISETFEEELRESMGEGMESGPVKRKALVDEKTVAWAIVGKAVLASTNQKLLERAVTSYRSNENTMTADAKFNGVEGTVIDGSQQIGMISLSRIAEGVRNTVDQSKMDKDSTKLFQSIVSAFENLNEPFTTKMRIQTNGRFAGGTFIPLDYDKLLNMAGDAKKEMEKAR